MSDLLNTENNTLLEDAIPVNNAGLVLLNAYFPMLFDRLDLTENGNFKNNELQLNAVHYLQYLASGKEKTEEAYLSLNKVLCGIPIATPIQEEINISEEQKKLMDGLLVAAIDYWPAIGSSTNEGFRGNWLISDGILSETIDRWELTVEKRAYDLLINNAPFSFAIIKFPWMIKPLHVHWDY